MPDTLEHCMVLDLLVLWVFVGVGTTSDAHVRLFTLAVGYGSPF